MNDISDVGEAAQAGAEVTIPAGDDFPATGAYAILPPGATRGMVVIHEISGRAPEIDRVVQRFARLGYAAVEPDLFRAPSRLRCVRSTVNALATGEGYVIHQANAVRRWLCDNAQLEEKKVGIIGFCFGGGFALAVGRGWGAVSTNYGSVPDKPELIRGLPPTIGCYGGRDLAFGKMGPVLESRLKAQGVEVETHTFPDVGHSFLTDGHHPIMRFLSWPIMHVDYKPATAEMAWGHITEFFDKHLG